MNKWVTKWISVYGLLWREFKFANEKPWVKCQRPVTRRLINLYTPYNCRLKWHLPTTSTYEHDSHAESNLEQRFLRSREKCLPIEIALRDISQDIQRQKVQSIAVKSKAKTTSVRSSSATSSVEKNQSKLVLHNPNSVANIQRQLDPLAFDPTIKKLTSWNLVNP